MRVWLSHIISNMKTLSKTPQAQVLKQACLNMQFNVLEINAYFGRIFLKLYCYFQISCLTFY